MLGVHRYVAGPATEVGAISGINNLEAVRNGMNGWCVVALALRQAGNAGLAAFRATQLLVPFIGHPAYRSSKQVRLIVILA
jgi:hypothetical protein